jgi:hypothetical protein
MPEYFGRLTGVEGRRGKGDAKERSEPAPEAAAPAGAPHARSGGTDAPERSGPGAGGARRDAPDRPRPR